MTTFHQWFLVLGLFGVPIVLLALGHRIKRTTTRRQRIFWGALGGHMLASVLAIGASLVPPIGWLPSDALRGALGVWSLVLLPLAGALIASLLPEETAR